MRRADSAQTDALRDTVHPEPPVAEHLPRQGDRVDHAGMLFLKMHLPPGAAPVEAARAFDEVSL